MASKKSAKNTLKEAVTLSYKLQRFVSYADFFNRVPLFISLQVSNQSSETIDDIDVVIENASGLLLPFSKHLEHLPFESTVEIATEDVLSPLYLTEISEITVQPVTIKALSGATVIVEERAEVTVLPLRLLERPQRQRRTFILFFPPEDRRLSARPFRGAGTVEKMGYRLRMARLCRGR